MNNNYMEVFIPAPWGKLALITWGDPTSEPILMMHGRQDSAATFIPLVDVMPKNYYYVAVDLPGHGRSDMFPKGIALSRYHFIHVVEVIVRHMGWKNFIFLGHSMGCELGLFYNASSPGVITRFVHLDVGPTFQRLQQPDHEAYYKHYYHRFYSNYPRYNGPNRLYTESALVEAIMKVRGLSETQARLILSRNMVHVEGDKYRLSFDPRSKYVTPQNLSNDYYLKLFTTTAPTLFVSMTEGHAGVRRGRDGAEHLIQTMMKMKHAKRVVLTGGHDHHVTNPGEVSEHVVAFLNEGFASSKL